MIEEYIQILLTLYAVMGIAIFFLFIENFRIRKKMWWRIFELQSNLQTKISNSEMKIRSLENRNRAESGLIIGVGKTKECDITKRDVYK